MLSSKALCVTLETLNSDPYPSYTCQVPSVISKAVDSFAVDKRLLNKVEKVFLYFPIKGVGGRSTQRQDCCAAAISSVLKESSHSAKAISVIFPLPGWFNEEIF